MLFVSLKLKVTKYFDSRLLVASQAAPSETDTDAIKQTRKEAIIYRHNRGSKANAGVTANSFAQLGLNGS